MAQAPRSLTDATRLVLGLVVGTAVVELGQTEDAVPNQACKDGTEAGST